MVVSFEAGKRAHCTSIRNRIASIRLGLQGHPVRAHAFKSDKKPSLRDASRKITSCDYEEGVGRHITDSTAARRHVLFVAALHTHKGIASHVIL